MSEKKTDDRLYTREDMKKVQKALKEEEQQEEEIHKVEKRTGKMDREIRIVMGVFIVMFVAMIAYFVYYMIAESEDTIQSSYNSRLDTFSETVVRGSILGNGGEALAYTYVDEDGNEEREYPYANLFAHVVGYTDAGQTGLEASSGKYLLQSHTGVTEQISNELNEVKNMGDSVVTTLDPYLQQLAYDALGDYNGACVIMEPDTGKILAMVSKPDYDPNTISEDWEYIASEDNESANLLNRATQGLYPPGSTFKLLTALEFMREYPTSWEDYEYVCEGSMTYGDSTMNCYNNSVHGRVDLRLSVANSCNTSFGTIGQLIDGGSFKSLCESFFFNGELPLSDGIEYYESSFEVNEDSDMGEMVQTAIGQGETLISPIHNAMIVSAIANGGVLMQPYLIDSVESADGRTVEKFLPEAAETLMTAEEAATLTDFMEAVINEGTSTSLSGYSYQIAGKTGSAEFSSNKEESHAWFVGFAPADDPEIVISIVYENGGIGGAVATAGARSIFEGYFGY